MWAQTLYHTLAVSLSLIVAVILIKVLHVDSPTVGTVIMLVVVALEKFIRANDKIPVSDWVNE